MKKLSREERDSLQERLDEYEKIKSGEISVRGKRAPEGAIKLQRMMLGMFIEPFIPKMEVGGFDLSIVIGPALKMFAPKLAEGPMKFAIVEGHGEAWEKLEREYGDEPGCVPQDVEDKFDAEYGISVPSDIAAAAMDIRTSKKMAELAIPNLAKKVADDEYPSLLKGMKKSDLASAYERIRAKAKASKKPEEPGSD